MVMRHRIVVGSHRIFSITSRSPPLAQVSFQIFLHDDSTDFCALRSSMNLAEYIESRHDEYLAELCSFLRIPSVSAKSEHKQDVEHGARWVADNLRTAGFKTVEIIPTNLHPLVYGEYLEVPGKPTVLFYGHYDVQ